MPFREFQAHREGAVSVAAWMMKLGHFGRVPLWKPVDLLVMLRNSITFRRTAGIKSECFVLCCSQKS